MSSSDSKAKGRRGAAVHQRGKEFEKPPESHAERAAALLAMARSAAKQERPRGKRDTDEMNAGPSALQPSFATTSASASTAPRRTPTADNEGMSDAPIALPAVLKSLTNPTLGASSFTVKEAIPLAGKLVRAKLNTQARLAHLNGPVLDDAGITSEMDKHKILIAFGVRVLRGGGGEQIDPRTGAKRPLGAPRTPQPKRRRAMDDEALSREYGNVSVPGAAEAERGLGGEQRDYVFHEVLEESTLRGRFAVVNRAPVMTTWVTLVLERLGFQRREALSMAHCYVNTTATARGIAIGVLPSSERSRSVHVIGSNQPHFELMGVKIPLMKLSQTDEWRGISAGQVVGPDQAFDYMRKAFYQTLPLVVGALTLLADSFVNGDQGDSDAVKSEMKDEEGTTAASATETGPDLLHKRAYELYVQFRPATAGEWGKKSTFYCDKALALRCGHHDELARWEARHESAGGDGAGEGNGEEDQEAKVFEEELRALLQAEGGTTDSVIVSEEGVEPPDDDEDSKEAVKAEVG